MKKLICLIMVLGFAAGLIFPTMAQSDDSSNKVLREGILGAATGAVAAGASGGKAGKGALIGAGTNVIGGALLDTLTGPSQQQAPVQQQPVYVQQQPVYAQPQPVYVQQQQAPSPEQMWYQKGYQDGFKAGYNEGFSAHRGR